MVWDPNPENKHHLKSKEIQVMLGESWKSMCETVELIFRPQHIYTRPFRHLYTSQEMKGK